MTANSEMTLMERNSVEKDSLLFITRLLPYDSLTSILPLNYIFNMSEKDYLFIQFDITYEKTPFLVIRILRRIS